MRERPLVCFLGGARYSQPLDATSEKKFCAMTTLGELFLIGFSRDLYPRKFTEHAHFYLLPQLPSPILRYMGMFTIGLLVTLWVVLRHGIHILVAQSPYEGCMGVLAKKIAGWLGYKVVLVVESHGDFEKSLFLQRRVLLPRLCRFLMCFAAGFALKHADLLRAVSNSTKEQLKQWAPGKPIFQFAAWTDIESFLQVGAERDAQSPQDILYAGALIPLKGIHHLVSAFAHIVQSFPQARLVIIGGGENKIYAAKLGAQIKQLGLNEQVQFVADVPQKELARRMGQARVFVLPSYSEGLPRVVFEAMAVGLPIIASAVSGIPEIVQDDVTGFLIQPGDEYMLAEKLRWVLAYPEEAREMGHRARAFAKDFFSTETYIQNYAQMFKGDNVY